MDDKKSSLPSLRNVNERKIKIEKKNKASTKIDMNKKHYRIKLTNLCRSEISLWKNRESLKELEQKWKLGREIWLETQIRNLRKQTKMIKQRENAGICWDKNEKSMQEKNDNKTRGNDSENTDKRGKIKMISTKSKTIEKKTRYSKTQIEKSTNK